ncbi:MAG: hypothetical protein KKG47_01245 [Proteobacteria bacterium]|nr:hypothetical protein [Pseudomonadota bacterium]MBU1736692.1 hypothetical protein [Pseudomonadota bacterium]
MSLCVLCAQRGTSCCVNRDILITTADAGRIAAYYGDLNFFEYRKPSSTAYVEQDDDPEWNILTVRVDGSRRVLNRQNESLCFFLTETGCRLSATVRPLVCRLHPVEYTAAGVTGVSPECPVQFLAHPETLLDSLQMNLTEAESWRRQLYEELRQDALNRKKVA